MQSLRDRVGQVYYTHGLFCSSHPVSILVCVCTLIVILCYPLLYTNLPGNAPAEYTTPKHNYHVPPDMYTPRARTDDSTDVTSIPRWYKGVAVGYIQQIVVKATVSPWEQTSHDPLDALRAPLRKVFDILEQVDKFTHQHGGDDRSMVNCCLRVSEPRGYKHVNDMLPQYSCLIVSPANLWHRNLHEFLDDKEILKTIFKRYDTTLTTSPGIREILFGLPWKLTGISKYFIMNRQRTITLAITLIMKSYDESFVSALKERLEAAYPETSMNVNNNDTEDLVHLHYKDINIYSEYIHLVVLYIVILMYLYFSVKKIEMVKSKWGLAFSAVVTVVSSLLISSSVLSVFGFITHFHIGESYPYLVVLIGIENILVVTKSVTSTSIELDVKCRVATGLSKEGWYITKNLLYELAIVIVGFFTFVPLIQEFCLFALVCVLTDFFLQMTFFVTVLSVDIRRMELSDLNRHKKDTSTESPSTLTFEPLVRCPFKSNFQSTPKLKTTPRLNLTSGMSMISSLNKSTSPKVQHEAQFFQKESILDLPRRLRLVYFWASTRVVQRFIMVCSVFWILLIMYKSGLVHHLTNTTYPVNDTLVPPTGDALEQYMKQNEQPSPVDRQPAMFWSMFGGGEEPGGSLQHTDLETWRQLSYNHWITLFSYYNITVVGKYITIIPTIHLSMIIPPDDAIRLRVPEYKSPLPQTPKVHDLPKIVSDQKLQNTRPQSNIKQEKDESLSSDSLGVDTAHQSSVPTTSEADFSLEDYIRKNYPYIPLDSSDLRPYYPRSRLEFVITVSLGFLSVIVVTYFVMVCYRCMCSRKYSKWRASWNKSAKYAKTNNYYKQIKDAVPIVLKGHLQEIECLVTDGCVIISSCLGGQLRVWDSITGECLHAMQRKSATPPMRRKPGEGREEDTDLDLYMEYHGNQGDVTEPTSLYVGQGHNDGRTVPRNRNVAEKCDLDLVVNKPTADRNKDRFEQFPNLAGTLDVNFTDMYRNKGTEQWVGKSGDNSNESKLLTAAGDKSKLLKEAGDKSKLLSDLETSEKGECVKPQKDMYDFKGRFGSMFSDHEKLLEEKRLHESQRRSVGDSQQLNLSANRSKSWSEGEFSMSDMSMNDSSSHELTPASIWCLACKGNLIVAGCGNGNIEFWDSTTGALKCLYGDSDIGVTGLNFVSKRVIVARLDGSIDFLELETFQDPKISTPLSPSSLNRKIKGHSRHLSHGRGGSDDMRLWNEIIHCTCVQHTQAHQRPITVLQTEGGRIVSGSQDSTLKVFRLEDYKCLYTLHGHRGAITVLFLDRCPPYAAVSGSDDGTLRLWDLLTGTCVHKVLGHDGTILGLTCTDTHMISTGLDDRMCVWERKRGHLLYSVDMETSCGSAMTMMSNNFLVTVGQGSLYLWDVHKGELMREVNLHDRDQSSFIHHLQSTENSTIICNYGHDIKVIHFPVVLEKRE